MHFGVEINLSWCRVVATNIGFCRMVGAQLLRVTYGVSLWRYISKGWPQTIFVKFEVETGDRIQF